jgi:hypothetical protein
MPKESLVENPKEFLSVKDLMALSSESENTWRARLGRREIPFVKFGVNTRVRRSDFEAWVAARTTPAADTDAKRARRLA